MCRFKCRLVVLSALSACVAVAQSSLSGPSLGVIFDPSAQAVRPLWGIPGSATAGPPIDLGLPLVAAAISPSQDYVLGVSTDGSVNIVVLTGNNPSAQALSGAMPAPDRIALSPTGQSAALYYAGANTVEIFTGMPNAAQATQQVDLSGLPNSPDTLAVSDDGSLLLAGVPENAGGAPPQGEIFVLASGGAPGSIAAVQHASALAFIAQSHDALFTDDVANSVTLVQDAGGSPNVAWTFNGQTVSAPDSVQASPDRKSFLVGSSTGGMVAILDANGSNPTIVACVCSPSELRPLSAASTYQITEPSGGLFWMLDGQATYPRAVFVPIPSGSSANGAAGGANSGGIRP